MASTGSISAALLAGIIPDMIPTTTDAITPIIRLLKERVIENGITFDMPSKMT